MSKTPLRVQKKIGRPRKEVPDISAEDLEMLEDAKGDKIITDEELLDMLSI